MFNAVHTDTFSGIPNYSWVDRYSGISENRSDLAIIREVKRVFNLTDIRCKKEITGEGITLIPAKYNTIVFITFV